MIEISDNNRRHIVTDLMPDLTPLLDVMFMLIVFFILTANAVPYALDVNLPEDSESVTQAIKDPDILSVTLLADEGGWKINDMLYSTEEEFKTALKEKTQESKKVIVIGDKEVSMQKLLTVMVFLRKHNIEAADIIMENK
tara:strand:- start:70 stop:489 length:420 start_codon:yes stop_codon:yes gene_type:complete